MPRIRRKAKHMKITTILTILSFILLTAGIVLGIILIINLMNGNFIETYYPYSFQILVPEFYASSAQPDYYSTYHLTRITKTGETLFTYCAASFISGILAVILPLIIPHIRKKW